MRGNSISPTEARASSNDQAPDLSGFAIADLSSDFYERSVQRIVPLCAPEFGPGVDYHSLIGILDRELHLGLPPLDREVLILMLTGLSSANRFDGDIFIEPRLGENSAIHSCHSAILLTEIFRRAGLFDSANSGDPAIGAMRLKMTLGMLVHDMGEMLGEFSSLAARAHGQKGDHDLNDERLIFECSLRCAFQSVLEERPDYFYRTIVEMRSDHERGDKPLAELINKYDSNPLPVALEERIALYLSIYDLAELTHGVEFSDHDRFLGNAIKAIEHLQGTRHWIRFSTRESDGVPPSLFYEQSIEQQKARGPLADSSPATLPLCLADSARMVSSLRFSEDRVGEIFHYAKTSTEQVLAKSIRDATYLTVIELCFAAAPIFDAKATTPSPTIQGLVGDFFSIEKMQGDQLIELAESYGLSLNADTDSLRGELKRHLRTHLRATLEMEQEELRLLKASGASSSIQTNTELIARYRDAIESDFRPARGEVLGLASRDSGRA